MMKKFLVICIAFITLFSVLPAFSAEDTVTILLNGEKLNFPDAQPYIDDNGRTQIPIGVLSQFIGLETNYDEATGTVLIHREDASIKLVIGENILYADTDEIIMDTTAIIKDDRTFIPIRYVAQALHLSVEWDGKNNKIILSEIENSFDFSILSAMPKEKNYMMSPFSLKMALAMAANGADNTTRDEILSVTGIENLDQFNAYAKEFIENANQNENVTFNIANSIWNNTDNNPVNFSDTYKDMIATYFKGTASDITNANGAETINNWIALQTNNKIKDVITDDLVTASLSFLVNTIYFKGDWAAPFTHEATREDIFTNRNGTKKTVEFMHDKGGYYSYFENEAFKILAKPYKDNNIKMYFVLSEDGKQIDADAFENAASNMNQTKVNFKLPKFKTEYLHENLVDILHSLGIKEAFAPSSADFTNMYSKNMNVYISTILQKTFIEVDEKGTESAAATVVALTKGEMPMPELIVDFHCDRPFTYFIRNDATGEILFMGEYAFAE